MEIEWVLLSGHADRITEWLPVVELRMGMLLDVHQTCTAASRRRKGRSINYIMLAIFGFTSAWEMAPGDRGGMEQRERERAKRGERRCGANEGNVHDNRPEDGNGSLVESMAQRLKQLESERKRLKDEKNAAERRAERYRSERDKLHAQLQQCESSSHATSAPSSHSDECESNVALRKRLERAWSELADMKAFLNDYGLIWIGDSGKADNANQPSNAEQKHEEVDIAACTMDINTLRQRIDELNSLAGNSERVFAAGADGKTHYLQASQRLQLVALSDGFKLGNSPARRLASSASNRRFMKDIYDGFLPSELKPEYPEGISFELVDRSNTTCDDSDSERRICNAGGTSWQNNLLERLPKSKITRSGQIVDVRSDVQQMMNGKTAHAAEQANKMDEREQRRQRCLQAVQQRLQQQER